MYTLGAVFCLALFWVLRRRAGWWVTAPLALFGGALLALSWMGGLITAALSWVIEFVVGLIPDPPSASAVIAAVALGLFIVVVVDIWKDKKLDGRGQLAAIGLPVLFMAAGGSVGAAGSGAVAQIGAAASGLFGPLVGG